MKVVNIAGGLGNQMFQYAFALSLKEAFPDEDVYIDTSHFRSFVFKHYKGINLHNGFEIKMVFPNASLPIAGWRQILKVSYFVPNYVLSRLSRIILPKRKTEFIAPNNRNYSFIPEVFQLGDRYYEGYWQCVKYYDRIRPQLREVFAHTQPNLYNRKLIDVISNCHSVGIHIRRGDYLKEPSFRGICDLDYYQKAIKMVLSKSNSVSFFVFSNDMKWCQDKISPLVAGYKTLFITGNTGIDSCWDLFLMTYCEDLIIANSSFSWWGAYLNQRGGQVFAPRLWLNRDCEMDIYCPSWIRV